MKSTIHSSSNLPEKVIFVRQRMDASPKFFDEWLNDGYAVVKYDEYILPSKDKRSVNFEDYEKSGYRTLKHLKMACDSGALVVVDYNNQDNEYFRHCKKDFKVFLLGILSIIILFLQLLQITCLSGSHCR